MKKLFIKTYGCQMNEYDSARITDLLADAFDIKTTNNPEEADIILLNTCSVREKAQEKVFSDLGRYRLIKKNKPSLIIGVGGCVASQEGEMIFKRASYVNLVFGPQTLHRLPEMIKKAQKKNERQLDISFPAIEKFDNLPSPHTDVPTAFVTIMEGCNNFCSYCVVPFTRGREISRPIADVIDEIKILAHQGVREINLLGQNVNNYHDITPDGSSVNFAELLYKVAAIDNIDRLRFTTSHPKFFSADLIAVFAAIPKLANHLHLPVQSGSNRILTKMNRGYTAEDYCAIIKKTRALRHDISISTDFIVGFPDETEKDFQDTMNLISAVGFDSSFSFIYSPRPGTRAANLKDNVPMKIKKERLAILQTAIRENAEKISQNTLGFKQSILVTGHSKKNSKELTGRTDNNRVVNFEGNHKLIGNFADVIITEVRPNSLRGKISD